MPSLPALSWRTNQLFALILLLPLVALAAGCESDRDEAPPVPNPTPRVGGDDPEGDNPPGDDDDEGPDQVFVQLTDDETPDVIGFASLISEDRGTTVVITIAGAQPPGVDDQPAYIGSGTCGDRGSVAYELPPVIQNRSETTVDADLGELVDGDYFIAVQYTGDVPGVYEVVGCGEIDSAES